MTDSEVDTIDYYDRYAEAFAVQTAGLDLDPLYQRFLRHVRPGGRILDAGCGPGRDALAFAERGYEVVAFDASEAMVRLARGRVSSRAVARHMRFQDLHWQNEFDGIWTCASLLHVPKASFADVAARLAVALRPGGAWYMSFKLGLGERVVEGRLFVDYNAETLVNSLVVMPVKIAKTWTSDDFRPNRSNERWLNAIATAVSIGDTDAR
jgi:2-polyprenyl-3-methyl-5-hydroxy-6-metoxy-1,4-benzoquinol methylase